MKLFLFIGMALALASCKKEPAKLGTVDAYVPVYADASSKNITVQSPQPITTGGKIAVIGNYLFQVEEGAGIHVINISNPSAPQKISFINIPACNEVTLRGNFLYTNNGYDLVVLNISDISTITVSARVENAFPNLQTQYPPQTGVYFECPDPSKGPILRWELKQVTNPKCKR